MGSAHVPQALQLEDIDSLLEVFFGAFSDEYMQQLFPPNEVGRGYMRDSFASFVNWRQDGLSEVRVMVVKDENGTVLSGLVIWVVDAAQGGIKDWTQRWPAPRPGMDVAGLKGFFEGMEAQHDAIMHGTSHIFVEILMTSPAAQRRGHGSALLRAATKMADDKGQPAYLDAAGGAVKLYEKNGFVQSSDVDRSSEMTPMLYGTVMKN